MRTYGLDVCVLLGQDRIRAPGDAGVKEHDLPLKRLARGRREHQFAGHHLIARPEADVADPAQCGNVLILLPDGLSAAFDLDRACLLGEFLRRHLSPLIRRQCVQQADGYRGRGSETGARGRDIGQSGDLNPARHAGHPHGLPDELVLEVIDARGDLLLGIVDVDVVIEALLHDHVDVLVDRAVKNPAPVLPVVGRQVGSSPEEADTQGRLGDDHRPARTGHSSRASR